MVVGGCCGGGIVCWCSQHTCSCHRELSLSVTIRCWYDLLMLLWIELWRLAAGSFVTHSPLALLLCFYNFPGVLLYREKSTPTPVQSLTASLR